jgi:pimeloyl-ACP methyl ester carboxylesterase
LPSIDVAGDDIFYVRRSAAEGQRPVVFIHGAGGTHRHWGYQMQSISGSDLYALDLPGHGHSAGDGRSSIPDYTDFLTELLAALGLDRVTIVGHSMGGAIVQYLALTSVSSVDGLILVGTGARLRVLPAFLQALLDDFECAVEMGLGYAYSASAAPELVELGREEWLANAPGVMHGDFVACDHFDVMDRLGEIQCRTLVICGEEDRLTPVKYSQFLAERIGGATLRVIPGAGHMVMLEQPDEVSKAIETFLERTET